MRRFTSLLNWDTELGYFEEAGLTVELTNGGGADKVMTAVLAGQADIGFAGPEACIYTYLEGKENYPKVFGQLTKRDGSFLIGRSREEFTWENLRGKTVIGGRKGGVPEMTLEYVLRKNGLIPGQDVKIDTSVQFNMMAGAFAGGSVPLGSASSPSVFPCKLLSAASISSSDAPLRSAPASDRELPAAGCRSHSKDN